MGHLPHFVNHAPCLASTVFLIIIPTLPVKSGRPQREQVTCPRSHSWEAAEPGQALWASATLERLLVGKPFSEPCLWSKSHRRLFWAAKSDVNQGGPGASPAALTAEWPRQRVRTSPAAGSVLACNPMRGAQGGDAHSSRRTSVRPSWSPGRHQVTLTASPLFR